MREVEEVVYRWTQGISEREIYRSLGISRNTIKRILKQAKEVGCKKHMKEEELKERMASLVAVRKQPKKARRSGVQVYLSQQHKQIEAWREMPHMTANQMMRLFAEQGKTVCETSLRRYLKRHFPTPPVTTVHLEVVPGSQAQVDFGYAGLMRDPQRGKLRRAQAFIMTLSYSRYRFVRFVFKEDVKTWVDCHIRAFHFFGGVVGTVVLDNLKAGVTKADFYDPVLNRVYGELERHYGFVADPAKVRTPQHKGKVERSVSIVRQQVLAGRCFKDIEEANTYALQWCLNEIAHRPTRTTGQTPWERFTQVEKASLKPLPDQDYECPVWQSAKIQKDQHAVFEGSFYSVPSQYVGQTVWIRASQRMVDIFCDETRIKTHVRSSQKGQWVTDKADYPEQARIFLEKDREACLAEAEGIGPHTHGLLSEVLTPPTITRQRKAQAILRLAKQYTPHRLEAACKRAKRFGNLRYKCLKRILEEGLESKESEEEANCSPISLTAGSYLRTPTEFSFSPEEVRS